MTVPFKSVPSLKVPFVAVEFDASKAQQGPAIMEYRGLIIGQKLSTALGIAANALKKVASADEVATLCGRGSQIHRMAKAWFKNNAYTEAWIGVLDDAGGGTVGTQTLTITGPATAAGTIHVYIAGEHIQLAVAKDQTAAALGPLLAAAINANADLPCTAAAGGAGSEHIVTLSQRNKGTVGNAMDVRFNYEDGQALPAGLAIAIATGVQGATDPVLTTLIAAMGDTWFHVIAHPYSDATSLSAIEAELASRFGPMRAIDGIAITSVAGTQAAVSAIGDARNSPHSIIIAQPGKNPLMPPAEFAAAAAAVVAWYGNEDPARPFQTLVVQGMLPPVQADRFTVVERNTLLGDGIATSVVNASGEVELDRVVTTYQTNAAGTPDASYRDANSLLTLMYYRYSFRAMIRATFPRHKLANDGTRFAAGQAIVTPKIAKAAAVAWARGLEERGLMENVDRFATDLVVERHADDVNRLDFSLPSDLVNQLVVSAASIQFRL